MFSEETIIAEISGARSGDKSHRPTEKIRTKYDKVIISNNSDGYETDWNIVNVPDEYKNYYIEHFKTSKNAWYAQMNRSYAIKYAKEHGYRYCVQLDDNIRLFEISYRIEQDGLIRYYRNSASPENAGEMFDDMVDFLVTVLKNTNAGIAGTSLASNVPGNVFLRERYCYSFFVIDVERVPDEYQGDFEDDIEFRYKMAQMGVPMICACPLKYSKVSQHATGDTTGCRAAYIEAGVNRGKNMSSLYGDMYSRGISTRKRSSNSAEKVKEGRFEHRLKPFKLGILITGDRRNIDNKMAELLQKYACTRKPHYKVSEKKV